MKKIKLFSVKKNRAIDGLTAELYCNFYLVFDKEFVFTFLIESPNLGCSDRHPIKLIKHWIMLVEEDYVKYMRRCEQNGR